MQIPITEGVTHPLSFSIMCKSMIIKYILRLLVIISMSSANCFAAELHSRVVIQTGNHFVGANFQGEPVTFQWINNFGQSIHIKRAQYFMGAYMGMLLDFDADLIHIAANGSIDYVMRCEWDHYADPTGSQANNPYVDFGNDWITVQPGEMLQLSVQTNGPVYTDKWWGVQVQIYYTLDSGK